MMIEDDVIKEVRHAREEFARSHGYNLEAMVAYLRELDELSGRPVVRLAPRRVTIPVVSQTETFDEQELLEN